MRETPYTVHCKVPYTVTETVPCQVSKRVKVCVPETVCVKKARLVAVERGPACHDKHCGPACHNLGHGKLFSGLGQGRGIACHDDCHNRKWSFGNRNRASSGDCCEAKACLMSGLRQRGFTSLCSTGCCEASRRGGLAHCKTSCKDTCHDMCREGLLHRLFRNRFACDPCSTGAAIPSGPMPSEPLSPPKALPAVRRSS